MAQRRMFSKTITNSSQFLMMPQSSQNLYFHLGMNADDDGFCEHFTIMRMTESKPDDLKILQAKGFVNVFDDKVLVILDWKENNFIRTDRYKPSKYLEIYKEDLALLSKNQRPLELGIPNDNQTTTEVRLGKGRLELGEVKKQAQAPIQTADELWTKEIEQFINKYSPAMIKGFTNYWRQKNPQGKKELWQMQKVFDMGRRLATWKQNDDKFQHERNARNSLKFVNEMPTREDHSTVRKNNGFTSMADMMKNRENYED